jgi:sialate O-acetylesterase
MSRSRWFSPRIGFVMVAALGMTAIDRPVLAQPAPGRVFVKLKEPVASRVYQRDVNGRADIPIVVEEPRQKGDEVKLINASLNAQNQATTGVKLVDAKLVGVPVGGPYTISCQLEVGRAFVTTTVGPVFVGDLWVLAGQSNMQGVGDLIDVTPPHPQVMMLGMDGKWAQAEEPLHWLVDSPDPVHSGDPKTRAERSRRPEYRSA